MMIRLMTQDDVSTVAYWENQIFSDAWTAGNFLESLKNDNAWMLVSTDDEGKLTGYACIYHALDEAELENIAVFPEYRRKNIADTLLDYALHGLKEKGIQYIYLEVRESNSSAQGLYKKHGFETVGLRKNFYDRPKEHAFVMMKEL